MASQKCFLSGTLFGCLLCVPVGLANAQTSNFAVVFTVDMTAQVKAGTSNVYVGTFTNASPVNAYQSYKFWNSDPDSEQWESVAPENQDGSSTGNRYYVNGSGNQVLQLVDFNDAPPLIGASNTVILNVSGQANIWGAGYTALPPGTDGIMPPLIHFQSGSNQTLIFGSISGLISIGADNGYEF